MKSFIALALIPERDLKLALEALCAKATENDNLHSCVDYFEKKKHGWGNIYVGFYEKIQTSNQLYGIISAMR